MLYFVTTQKDTLSYVIFSEWTKRGLFCERAFFYYIGYSYVVQSQIEYVRPPY